MMLRSQYSIALALCLLITHGSQAYAQERQDEQDSDQALKGIIEANAFVITRGLGKYSAMLGGDFLAELTSLKASQRWIDMGSGEGIAIEDYLSIEGKDLRLPDRIDPEQRENVEKLTSVPRASRASVIGITYEMERERPEQYGEQYQVLSGAFFLDIPKKKIPKADLITDVYGVFAYSPRVDLVLERYLEILTEKGSIYIYNAFVDRDETISYEGEMISLLDWLKMIEGVEIMAQRTGGESKHEEVDSVRIRKIPKAKIRVPRLHLERTEGTGPPVRYYEVVKSS